MVHYGVVTKRIPDSALEVVVWCSHALVLVDETHVQNTSVTFSMDLLTFVFQRTIEISSPFCDQRASISTTLGHTACRRGEKKNCHEGPTLPVCRLGDSELLHGAPLGEVHGKQRTNGVHPQFPGGRRLRPCQQQRQLRCVKESISTINTCSLDLFSLRLVLR